MEFNFNKNTKDCWYNKSCDTYDTDDCTYYCDRYFRLKHLATYSLLTDKQQHPVILQPHDVDIDTFRQLSEIRDNIKQFVFDGNNLLIFSKNTGNGKTTWATKILMQYLQSIMWSVECTRPHALFIDVTDFLFLSKDTFNGGKSERLDYIKYWASKVKLVVWDDIISESISKYDSSLLFSIINNRINSGLSNIFTANATYDSLQSQLPPRLFSRIVTNSCCKEILGSDDRNFQISPTNENG